MFSEVGNVDEPFMTYSSVGFCQSACMEEPFIVQRTSIAPLGARGLKPTTRFFGIPDGTVALTKGAMPVWSLHLDGTDPVDVGFCAG